MKNRNNSQKNQKPMLRFSPTAWAKLLFMRDMTGNEVGGFGITQANDLLFVTDFALVFEKALKGKSELDKIKLSPGQPLKVMLALKADSIEDGFERVGKPCVFEYKYDGFRIKKYFDRLLFIKTF